MFSLLVSRTPHRKAEDFLHRKASAIWMFPPASRFTFMARHTASARKYTCRRHQLCATDFCLASRGPDVQAKRPLWEPDSWPVRPSQLLARTPASGDRAHTPDSGRWDRAGPTQCPYPPVKNRLSRTRGRALVAACCCQILNCNLQPLCTRRLHTSSQVATDETEDKATREAKRNDIRFALVSLLRQRHDELCVRWAATINHKVPAYRSSQAARSDMSRRLIAAMIERLRPGGDSAALVYSTQKLVELRYGQMQSGPVQVRPSCLSHAPHPPVPLPGLSCPYRPNITRLYKQLCGRNCP